MIIKVNNNLSVNAPKTFTSFNEIAGTNVLRWKNSNAFNASWAMQVGETGEEQTEVVLLNTSTPAGTAGTLVANTSFAHSSDTPLYAIKYNQIVFEKSATGTAGVATPITDGTLTIQADSKFTQFDDVNGTITDAYRTYYKNSVLNVTSSESDWITFSGYTFFSLAKMRQRVKDKLWDSSYIVDDSKIDDWINEWQEKMANCVLAVNEDYSKGTVNIGFGTNGLGTITNATFKGVKRFWVTWDNVSSYQSTKIQSNAYLPDQVFTTSHPYHDYVNDNVFRVHPSDVAGTAQIEFYQLKDPMVNDTDELPVPMRGYTSSFVDYGVAQALLKDNKTEEYNLKIGEANSVKEQFRQELSPRDKSSADKVLITDTLGGDFGGWM
jgi:hypothetical protein